MASVCALVLLCWLVFSGNAFISHIRSVSSCFSTVATKARQPASPGRKMKRIKRRQAKGEKWAQREATAEGGSTVPIMAAVSHFRSCTELHRSLSDPISPADTRRHNTANYYLFSAQPPLPPTPLAPSPHFNLPPHPSPQSFLRSQYIFF